eukprot:UN33038
MNLSANDDPGSLFPDSWEFHGSVSGWNPDVHELQQGDGSLNWVCWIKNMDCPSNSISAGDTSVTYPALLNGNSSDVACPSGYQGTVEIECRSGIAFRISGTCIQIVAPDWQCFSGIGVCRDINILNTGTGTGPGVSPPNFSKNGIASMENCQQECVSEPLLCNGVSYNVGITRCALFINT